MSNHSEASDTSKPEVEDGKRRKHNEAESKRRKRIKVQMDRLSSLLGDSESDQFALLTAATDILVRQQKHLDLLKSNTETRISPLLAAQDEQNTSVLDHEFLQIFLNSPVAIAISGLNGQFIDCNLTFEKTLGYSRAEISSFSMFALTPDDHMDAIFQVLSCLLKGEVRDVTFKKTCLTKAGCLDEFLVSVSLVRCNDSSKAKLFTCSVFPDTIQEKRF